MTTAEHLRLAGVVEGRLPRRHRRPSFDDRAPGGTLRGDTGRGRGTSHRPNRTGPVADVSLRPRAT